MEGERFDSLAKRLGQRFSRRVLGGGAFLGLASVGSLVSGHNSAVAKQDATPAAEPAAEDPEFLFVQTFEAGSWTPNPNEADTFLLTLTGRVAQTIFFSDRPERIVGALPTHQFLRALGFTPANPPNAALVAQTADGEDVIVLELFDPTYQEEFDADGGVTVTYVARVLANYDETALAHLAAQQTDTDLPESFGPASLFIDDCPDELIVCDDIAGREVGSLGCQGLCWEWTFPNLGCNPCRGWDNLASDCNKQFEACHGECSARNVPAC